MINHGYEPRSKLMGIVPSALRDCSTYQFQYASLLELEFHNLFQEERHGYKSGNS